MVIKWAWVVCGEQVHDVVCEVGHVLTDDVSDMTTGDLLEMNNHGTNLRGSPLGINRGCNGIFMRNNQCYWHFSDVLQVNKVAGPVLITDSEWVIEVRAPFLESIHTHVLSKQHHRLEGSTVRLMVNIYSKAVWIVSKGVVADEIVLNQLANTHVDCAVDAPEFTSLPVEWEDLVDVVHNSPVIHLIVVLGEGIHVSRVTCNFGYGTEGDEQVDALSQIILIR